jgi:hypothetical protein
LLVQRVAQLLMGFLWLSVAYLWLTYVLARFPLTEPLGDRLSDFLFGLLYTLGVGFVEAMPALTTALIILFLTKSFNDAIGNFFKAAREGRVEVPGLHPETVTATHRIVSILVWGLGIAVAYPFIPMSDSDAFKGLSVMFGFMLTLGSAGIVNQLMSGLVLVYSRALSVGDFVDIGENVGVVSEVGALSTKMINMRNEEVTIPNAVLVGSPIRNYSRLARRTRHAGVDQSDDRLRHAVAAGACHADRRCRTDTRFAGFAQAFRLPAQPGRLVRRVRVVRAHGQTARTRTGAVGTACPHPGPVQHLRSTDHVAAFRHPAQPQRGRPARALARGAGCPGGSSSST